MIGIGLSAVGSLGEVALAVKYANAQLKRSMGYILRWAQTLRFNIRTL